MVNKNLTFFKYSFMSESLLGIVMENIVIASYKRTPLGSFQGCLAPLEATDLGAAAIRGALLPNITPDEVYMGCVLQAGCGQAPARQAAIKAGLHLSVPAVSINKVCGSGMQSVAFACNSIIAGYNQCVVAGGMESMTNSPYLLPKARSGYRSGHNKVIDHMFLDGLEDAYNNGSLMGFFAEKTAERYGFTREVQDEFAKKSVKKALAALENQYLQKECVKLDVKTRKGQQVVEKDEIPGTINLDKIPILRPAFKQDGTVTAASSSAISDGAAALLLTSESYANIHSIKPIAKVVSYTASASSPEWFTIAPVEAIQKAIKKANWTIEDVDLFEINEAFAVVTMSAIQDLSLDPDKVNVFGGACALGHPLGASGARIIVTLLNAMQTLNKRRGLAALCVGGGEATAICLELL